MREGHGSLTGGRDRSRPVIALFGATALGKTEIAVALAEQLGGEIVSADAMQVYAGVPILTNQPAGRLLARVPHHLVGTIPPSQEFSAAAYAKLAAAAIADIEARGHLVILEGGSGLYLRAALGGLAFGPPPSAALRAKLEQRARDDPAGMVAELAALDAATAATVDVANPRRLVRALEIVRGRGGPLSSAQRSRLWSTAGEREHLLFALEPDREALRVRVDARVEAMMSAGLVDEVRRVCALGPLSRTLQQAIGLREIVAYLEGRRTLDEARTAIQARTRAYARRQLTWMRKLPDAARIPATDRPAEAVAGDIAARVAARGQTQ